MGIEGETKKKISIYTHLYYSQLQRPTLLSSPARRDLCTLAYTHNVTHTQRVILSSLLCPRVTRIVPRGNGRRVIRVINNAHPIHDGGGGTDASAKTRDETRWDGWRVRDAGPGDAPRPYHHGTSRRESVSRHPRRVSYPSRGDVPALRFATAAAAAVVSGSLVTAVVVCYRVRVDWLPPGGRRDGDFQ